MRYLWTLIDLIWRSMNFHLTFTTAGHSIPYRVSIYILCFSFDKRLECQMSYRNTVSTPITCKTCSMIKFFCKKLIVSKGKPFLVFEFRFEIKKRWIGFYIFDLFANRIDFIWFLFSKSRIAFIFFFF